MYHRSNCHKLGRIELVSACFLTAPGRKSCTSQIAHEENVVSGPVAYVQCALLYTSSNGERRIRCGRPSWGPPVMSTHLSLGVFEPQPLTKVCMSLGHIRVHSLAVPIVSDVPEMYNGADSAALACMTAKLAVEKCLLSKLEETRQMVQQKVWINDIAVIIHVYRVMH